MNIDCTVSVHHIHISQSNIKGKRNNGAWSYYKLSHHPSDMLFKKTCIIPYGTHNNMLLIKTLDGLSHADQSGLQIN